MLRQDSMSTRMAKVALQVAADGGCVTEEEMDRILSGFGITRQRHDYKRKMCEYGYLAYNRDDTMSSALEGQYCLTKESRSKAEITITVKPSLYAEEVRRHIEDVLAAYKGVIEVGEVNL